MPSTNEQPERRYVRPPQVIVFPTEAEWPETKRHLEIRTNLYTSLLRALRASAMIGSGQFVYWDPTDPSKCLAPDAFVRLGAPDELFDSWKVWDRGAPQVAVEIVGGSDATEALWTPMLAKYHRLGVLELARFDMDSDELRIWDSVEGDLLERVLVEGQPVECVPLGLYWVVAPDDASQLALRLARDGAGKYLLPTPEENLIAARAERDAAVRGSAEIVRAERDAALERVRVLEEELAKRR